MAILAPPDWQYSPRDPQMDKGPQQSSSSSSTPPQGQPRSHHQQQQTTPQSSSSQQQPPPQPHAPYPFQQQPQGAWTPSIAAPPFYPAAFVYNQQQPSPQGYPQQPGPYFDPANAQLAQWAYQQMMFNAAQQQAAAAAQQQQHQQHDFFQQNQLQQQPFNPFPSGTPPPRPSDNNQSGGSYPGFHPYRRPSRQQSSHSEAPAAVTPDAWRPQPPYSRGDASGSSSSVNSQGRPRTNSNNSNSNGRTGSSRSSPSPVPPSPRDNAPPRMPHHRNASSSSSHSHVSSREASAPPLPSSSSNSASSHSASTSSGSPSPASVAKRPSPLSQGTFTAPPLTPSSSQSSSQKAPSSTTRADRRLSRDDSRRQRSSSPPPPPPRPAAKGKLGHSSSGLKGRLRRALARGGRRRAGDAGRARAATRTRTRTRKRRTDDDESIKASVVNPPKAGSAGKAAPAATSKPKTPALIKSATRKPGLATASALSAPDSPVSTTSAGGGVSPAGAPAPAVPPKKKSRAASLFNSRLNASTDNISLSSTVSSASVMIRKLGSMGRLARRNSLAGITSLFKGGDRRRGEEQGGSDTEGEGEGGDGKKKDGKGKGKDKGGKKEKEREKQERERRERNLKGQGSGSKSGKGEASEASVSHATAELDRASAPGDWSVPASGELTGLSPAAKLARQHTLKSNAEAAAKAKAAAEAAAARSAAAAAASAAGSNGVPTWERNTTTRHGAAGGAAVRVAEDGSLVLVEEPESDEDEYGQGYHNHQQQQQQQQQAWAEDEEDEDEEWGLLGGEEDDTIRVGVDGYGDEEHEPWATDVRRSVERGRQPAKGILKYAGTYDQQSYLADPQHPNLTTRVRSNSYNSHPNQSNELGPLARIPSPDPDHIDGLHRHGPPHSPHTPTNTSNAPPSLPPLAFDSGSPLRVGFDSPQATPTATTFAQAQAHAAALPAPPSIFNHPALNSSAPALTTLGLGHPTPPPLAHRSATAPSKKLAFASNLSVYDTFSASMYDRRSEPATWSRLTPALAQRIKEELNSYKMEEMEVHAASRIHTQFFV
ncbi:hypothetical protein C8J57DRAFT_1211359 [Mycena rebaudengoi]|nr:hypothetical protein C8J57DRAFT_1211359 [Mycena rebaudengoi]